MFNVIVTLQALSQSIQSRVHARGRELCSYIIWIPTRGNLREFFLFIISIENCDVQHHSSYTGSIAIYLGEVSRERSRVICHVNSVKISLLRLYTQKKNWMKFVVSPNSFLGHQHKFGRKERRNLPGPFIWTLRSPLRFPCISVTATCKA